MVSFPRRLTLQLAPLLLTALSICIQTGCTTDECFGNRTSTPLAGFYSSYFPEQPLTLDSVTLYGIGAKDSLLINNNNVSQTYFPLRIDSDSTSFVIRFQTSSNPNFLTDTITLVYDREPYFVSPACGAMYNYRITSFKTSASLVDSVSFPTGIINNQDIENMHIYMRLYPSNP